MSIPINSVVQVNLNVNPESTISVVFNKAIVLGTSLSSDSKNYTYKLHEYTKDSFSTQMAADGYTVSGDELSPEFIKVQAYFAQATNLPSIYVGEINTKSTVQPEYTDLTAAVTYFRNQKSDWYFVCLAEESGNSEAINITNANDNSITNFISAIDSFSVPTFLVIGTGTSPELSTQKVYTNVKNTNSYNVAVFYGQSTVTTSAKVYVTIDASVIGRLCSLNTLSDNSAYTLSFKTLNNEKAIDMSQSTLNTLTSYNANSYINFGNNSYNLIYPSLTAKGFYVDESLFIAVAKSYIQNGVMSQLVNNRKIPLTDDGMGIIYSAISEQCERMRSIGFIDSGIWNGETVGSLTSGTAIPNGYYIEIAPVSSLTSSERALRKSPNVKVALKSTGAVENIAIDIYIDR